MKIHSNLKGLECHNISPIISLWGFSRHSRAANSTVQGPIWPIFEPIRSFIGFILVSNVKNEGARVITKLCIDFSKTQRQLTLKLVVESCLISNSSTLLSMVLLPARIKKINPMGIFSDTQWQLTHNTSASN